MYSLNTTVFQDLLTWVFTFTNKGKREMKTSFAILLIVITCLAWATFTGYATHWSGGKVDGYSSKLYGMLSMVGIMIVLYIFLNVYQRLIQRKRTTRSFLKLL